MSWRSITSVQAGRAHRLPSQARFSVVGRRGGKSFISSLTAVFIACFSDFKRYLNAGEKAAILILARDRHQAKIVFNYVSGILHAIPALSAMIEVERADEIDLTNAKEKGETSVSFLCSFKLQFGL